MRYFFMISGLLLVLISPFSFAEETEDNDTESTETEQTSDNEKSDESTQGTTEAEPDCE